MLRNCQHSSGWGFLIILAEEVFSYPRQRGFKGGPKERHRTRKHEGTSNINPPEKRRQTWLGPAFPAIVGQHEFLKVEKSVPQKRYPAWVGIHAALNLHKGGSDHPRREPDSARAARGSQSTRRAQGTKRREQEIVNSRPLNLNFLLYCKIQSHNYSLIHNLYYYFLFLLKYTLYKILIYLK